MAWQNLAGFRRQLLFGWDVPTKCSKDDPRREPARTDAFEKALSLFRWDATKIEKLVLLDRCRTAYGPTFWIVLGNNPRYEPLYILWPYLTPAEQQMVIHLMPFPRRGSRN
jgi:hypothetical protein